MRKRKQNIRNFHVLSLDNFTALDTDFVAFRTVQNAFCVRAGKDCLYTVYALKEFFTTAEV